MVPRKEARAVSTQQRETERSEEREKRALAERERPTCLNYRVKSLWERSPAPGLKVQVGTSGCWENLEAWSALVCRHSSC